MAVGQLYISNCGGVWLVNEVVFAIRLQGGATPNGRFDSFPLRISFIGDKNEN